MKHLVLPLGVLFVLSVGLFSCQQKPASPAPQPLLDSLGMVDEAAAPIDSTLYGRAAQSGMSTFCLITDEGDTILVTRATSDGVEGIIYGSLVVGDRFSLMTTEEGEALRTAINLTQVERFTSDYRVLNGQLVLHPDSVPEVVTIDQLTNKVLRYHTAQGDVAQLTALERGGRP